MNKVHSIPTCEEYISLQENLKKLQSTIDLKNSPNTIIRYSGQVDLMNKLSGNSPVKYEFVKHSRGGTINNAVARKAGIKIEYSELPYEWVWPWWTQAELHFPKGPLKYIRAGYGFEGTENHWQVKTFIEYRSRGLGILGYFTAKKVLQQLNYALSSLDKNAIEEDYLSLAPFMDKERKDDNKSKDLTDKLTTITRYPEISKLLANYILYAPEKFVSRMRPIEIAEHFKIAESDTITFFLRATKGGLLNLSWDIICPSCRGASGRVKNLSHFAGQAHCDMCLIDMSADLAENVELTFSPVNSVRKIKEELYCVYSPSSTPHVHSQVNVWPGIPNERRYSFQENNYTISTIGCDKTRDVVIQEDGAKSVQIVLPKDLGLTTPLVLSSDCLIEWKLEDSEYPYTVKMNSNFREKALIASRVTAMQEFRDLFSSEVLSPNIQVKVSNLTFLFTDLKDSTPMYENMGDASAFALVRDHFQLMEDCIRANNGAIVKTIGDAVMAVFVDLLAAKKAAISIQKKIQSKFPNVKIKIGIHPGSSLAVNSNDKLDYFGTTVNKAARIQGLAEGGEIVMEAKWDTDDLPLSEGFQRSKFQSELKGIRGDQELVRWKIN